MDDAHLEAYVENPVLRQILASRGVRDAVELKCALADLLHYASLKNIDKAAEVIAAAVREGEPILVAGDYDVDGLTGTALGVKILRAFGAAKVSFSVPSRYEGGYGLSEEVVQRAISEGVKLIITVDNGISCHQAAQSALKAGIKLVITDHHECQSTLPQAQAIVDPKQSGDQFPSSNLCGAGVLFYVLCAVRAALRESGWFERRSLPKLSDFLDLVALGTIGDVVPLDANNRRLVKNGLTQIRQGRAQQGILALARICRLSLPALTAHDVAFAMCPRLNAPGRLKLQGANPAIELLLCDDAQRALELAQSLDMCNRRRGDFERVALREALTAAKTQLGKQVVVLYGPQWLTGILGLIAGRVREQLNLPVFVFSGADEEGSELQGSGRSVPGCSLSDILGELDEENPTLLVRYGGHAMAAGVSLLRENLELFDELLCEKVAKAPRCGDDELYTDGELPESCRNLEFACELEEAGPWGSAFPEPVFDGTFVIRSAYLMTGRQGGKLLRLGLYTPSGASMQAVMYRASDEFADLKEGMTVRLAYVLSVDRYMRNQRLEIVIKELERVTDGNVAR